MDTLQANFKRLIADRTQLSKAPNITFMIVVRCRNRAKQVVINGFIEARQVSEARWRKWLPMFEWNPIEGGLHGNAEFQALMAEANTASRLRATLHQQGQLSPAPKRVRIGVLLHAFILGYLPMIYCTLWTTRLVFILMVLLVLQAPKSTRSAPASSSSGVSSTHCDGGPVTGETCHKQERRPRTKTCATWKFSAFLDIDMPEPDNPDARFDAILAHVSSLMDSGTKPPHYTFLVVFGGREEDPDEDNRARVIGYVVAQPAGEARWTSWMPMFMWEPVQGGLNRNAEFRNSVEAARSDAANWKVLHTHRALTAGAKRVSHPSKADCWICEHCSGFQLCIFRVSALVAKG